MNIQSNYTIDEELMEHIMIVNVRSADLAYSTGGKLHEFAVN